MEDGNSFSQLVVVGSSAGGIEALSTLVTTLPPDFPAPVVIAQHLDPTRESHLTEILAQRSTLPVRTLAGYERLEAGVVFVVPANQHVEITDHDIHLRRDVPVRSMPSIDLLFTSAAQVFGDGLIAVILTGTGHDGAAGAREVHKEGGMVIIQNPATAAHPELPRSLAPNTVDLVAQLEEIGPLAHSILTGSYIRSEEDAEPQLQSLLDLLRERNGVDFSAYKRPTIMRRLQRRMAATGTRSLAEYLRYLQRHPAEYNALISSFLIKVTEFFRDEALFDHLRQRVLPDIVDGARRRGNEIRLWSAGCATGEEAYSLAILVAEALGDELDQYHVRIFATDLDEDAITFARQGIYAPSAVAGLEPAILSRYFDQVDGAYQIKKRIRTLTVFGEHDLAERAPLPRIDLLLCRNVLIYFTQELQRRVLQLFAFSLRDGGYMVLGKSETTYPLPESFVSEDGRLKVYRRRGDRLLVPSGPIRDVTAVAQARALPARSTGYGANHSPQHRPASAKERAESVLLLLPMGVVVVDRRYDIQSINNSARVLLGIHTTAVGEDLIHLAQSISPTPLREAIDTSFRDASTVTLELDATDDTLSTTRHLQITCYPQRMGDGPVEALTVTVADVTVEVEQRREIEQARERARLERSHLAEQVEQLTRTSRQLLEANQELTRANMELRSENEEFLVGNEELQAAAEEVETLNEELQATNEELETLNEELQATVEELNTTNDDLQARSSELQELAIALEAERRDSEIERARLTAVLGSMGDAILVVDPQGRAVLTNPAYTALFGEDAGDLVVEVGDDGPLPPEAQPRMRAARGESFSLDFAVTRPDGSRARFEANGQPISRDGDLDGGVVVIRDVTDRPPH